jgi:tetratricopeptide (TPR) repeat protein
MMKTLNIIRVYAPVLYWVVFAWLLVTLFVPRIVFAACLTAGGEQAVRECRQELDQEPRNLQLRYRLADSLKKLGKKNEAVLVLKQGMSLYPGDAIAQSELEERISFAERENDLAATGNDAQTSVNVILCRSSGNLEACNKGLEKLPDNIDLLVGKGNALLGLDPPKVIDAINVFRKALSVDSKNQAARTQLAVADKMRQRKIDECMNTMGWAGYKACRAGLLPGSDDEAGIHVRSADLLRKLGKKDRALNEYQTALRLEPGNSQARQAIDALTAAASPPPPPTKPPEPPPRVSSNAPLEPGITY